MEGIDLLALNLEIEIDSDFPIDGAEAQRAELVQSNDSDSDFKIDEKGVLTDYNGNDSDVVIPDGVTAIGSYAFAGCDTITSVIIPKSVKKIKGFAFHGCKRLTSVLIPGNVISIGERAFGECHNLTNVSISKGVMEIGKEAFVQCDKIANITIPSSIARIDGGAFFYCQRLTNVTIQSKEITIKSYSTYYNEDEDETYYYDTFGHCSEALTFHIISGSNAIKWAKKNNYRYDVIKDEDSLSEVTLNLKSEQTHQLRVNSHDNSDVFWSSSDKTVATVNNGKVTGKKVGGCIISAKLSSGKILRCNVTVYDPAELNATTLNLNLGETYNLKVTGLLKRNVTWTSSNTTVATVKNGKITPKKAGKCTITATLSRGKYLAKKTLTCKLTVTDPARISKTSLTLLVGKTSTLKVSGIEGRKVRWSSSNEKVATVDRGKVKAIAAGKCNIIVKVGNKKLACAVTVTKPLTGDIHGILGKNKNSINKLLPDKLRYYEDDAYTNDYFLIQTDDSDDIISIALLTDAESNIGKYTLYGLYPGMNYEKACGLLAKKGWKLDSESYDESYFYNPKNSNVSFYVTIIDDEIDLIIYMYK